MRSIRCLCPTYIFTLFFSAKLIAAPIPAQVQNYWFNGAEITSYTLSQSRYGENHPGNVELIYVTEPFLTNQQVKNESGKSGRGPSADVLKLNSMSTFNTGLYSYRTMASTFRPLDLENFPFALKSTTSIQDWCGQSFTQMNFDRDSWKNEIRSYFEKPADVNRILRLAPLEETLWITLRLNPKALPVGKFRSIPAATFLRFHHLATGPYQTIAKRSNNGSRSTYTLRYPSLQRVLTIVHDTKFPHVIRSWKDTTPDGTTTATFKRQLQQVPYWNLNKPSDAALRKRLALSPHPN